MKLKALGLLLLTACLYTAPASAENLTLRYERLYTAVKEQCKIPDHMNTYSENILKRYVSQFFLPELKMLNTAFMVGFSAPSSANIATGYCTVVFLGLPNDPVWEDHSNFYAGAQEHNTLPAKVFAGFADDDTLLLQNLGAPVN